MNTPTQTQGGESATPRTDKSHNAIAARLADQWCRCTKQADNTQEYLVQLVKAALEESAAVGQTYYDHLFKRYEELERETATLHAQLGEANLSRDALRNEFDRREGVLNSLHAQIAALQAKVAEGEADRERLDWLEANLTRLHELDRDEVTYRMEYFTDKQEHLATTCSTIRRCIDAARTQEATQ